MAGPSIWDLEISSDGRTVAVHQGRALRLWRVGSRAVRTLRTNGQPSNRIAFSDDSRRVGLSLLGGSVAVWDSGTGERFGPRLNVNRSANPVLAFGPRGTLLANSP
jgi:WD40 repeat protein